MKKNDIKIQLGAMNEAIAEFVEKQAIKQELSPKEVNAIKQRAMYGESYNNMEVYRSNKLYKTMVDRADVLLGEIKQVKTEDEE